MVYKIIQGICETELRGLQQAKPFGEIHLTLLNPPYSQQKSYARQNGVNSIERYWSWMNRICKKILDLTANGGSLYFLHNEANTEIVLKILRTTGWTFQNLIIWNKISLKGKPSNCYDNQYQILAFASKGEKPRVFNRLRIELQLSQYHKAEHGMDVTDVWSDVFSKEAGSDTYKPTNTKDIRLYHENSLPLNLVIRIVLASSLPGDVILDPFAGTGITTLVAERLDRNSISIEFESQNIQVIKRRILLQRQSIQIPEIMNYYRFTNRLKSILPVSDKSSISQNIVNSLGTFLYRKTNG